MTVSYLPSFVVISVNGKEMTYERLNVLEFSSDRKRMSVILRDRETGQIKLYIKGADDMILSRLYNKGNAYFYKPY